MPQKYIEFMTAFMKKHKGEKEVKLLMKDGAKEWKKYKDDNGIVIQAKEKSTGPSYKGFVQSYSKTHPGPDLMKRAAEAWKDEKSKKPKEPKEPSPQRKRTRKRTPLKKK